MYAPGSDLEDAIDSILYHRSFSHHQHYHDHRIDSRDCTNSSLVRDLATFHVFFDFAHTPDRVFICFFICLFAFFFTLLTPKVLIYSQVPLWKLLLNKRPNCLKPEGALLITTKNFHFLKHSLNLT